jgi:hypothetical protein
MAFDVALHKRYGSREIVEKAVQWTQLHSYAFTSSSLETVRRDSGLVIVKPAALVARDLHRC